MKRSPLYGEAGYKREENDFYRTPEWCVEALLKCVVIDGDVWEPCCGDGAILEALRSRLPYSILGTDIESYGHPHLLRDFFSFIEMPEGYRTIITNPPYNKVQEFLEHALNLTHQRDGRVITLLRHEYDCAATRQHLFKDHSAFSKKITLTKRPKWFTHEKAAPRHNFSWYVWDWTHKGPPELDYAQ